MVREAIRAGKRRFETMITGDGVGREPPAPHESTAARLPAELAPFMDALSPSCLQAARRRARRIGVGGDEVLRQAGYTTPEDTTARTARYLGVDAVERVARLVDACPHEPGRAADWAKAVVRTGVVATQEEGGGPVFTMAVEGRPMRRLARALKIDPKLRQRLRLIAPPRLREQLMTDAGEAIARDAAFTLRDTAPEYSAGTLDAGRILLRLVLLLVIPGVVVSLVSPTAAVLALQALLSMIFLSWYALRLAGCCFAVPEPKPPPELDDRHLPVYSLLIPLYKEAAVVPRLVAALGMLDYPPEKLDIKLVVEADDAGTRAAIAAVGLPPYMEEVALPNVGPRTKPKALNAALTFVRGRYVAIYDAEDHPEPDQLKRALAAFRTGGPRVACVQARLCIDNGAESWISGHFAAEYASQFDVMLPMLDALDLPILLGGTSNHFRRDVLERIGAWDPFNVTEDADLGVRLSRGGWRTAVIASTTYEEAPVSLRAWIGQRTRWLKGWAQTILVHGRHPRVLVDEIGWRATAILAALTAGPFASALLHPFCIGLLAWDIARGVIGLPCATWGQVAISALTYATLAVGYVGMALTMSIGLGRRGERLRMGLVLTIPFYWLLLSLAAWRAVRELVHRPHHWEKTTHGLSRRRSPTPSGEPRPQK